jgi:RND family efflux transporter MFP subunit
MHPQVIQDHPGDCPICGMKLTLIRNDDAPAATADPGVISVDATTRQYMNLRTVTVQRGVLRKTIRTVGTIDYAESALAEVTTKFRGWVQNLNVDTTGQLVHRGEPLFEIDSPELYNAEAEYVQTLVAGSTNDPATAGLRSAAAEKLRFLDVPEAQITRLEQTRQPLKSLPVIAPVSGFVIEKNVVAGQMVDAGARLYRIADLSVVWVLAEIYEQDLAAVQLGQEAVVRVAAFPDREFRGRVTYVYPTVDEKTRTARVRLEFENPGFFLKPGMFVSVQLSAQLADSALLVPESAVLRSGAKNTVFVALDDGKFTARDVVLGVAAEDGREQVLQGLQAGERIVTSGQFLLDSESQLREAIEKMRDGGPAPGRAEISGTNPPPATTVVEPASAGAAPVVYVCPMPEHVSIVYDQPGNCPICGMSLVPVNPSTLAQIQPGGRVLYYTCPMPEHANIHETGPGKCPLCQMTLIPVMAPPTNAAPALPTHAAPARYYCPMHPQVTSDHPGKCSQCGMDLVPQETN